jgi:hypothetical protein
MLNLVPFGFGHDFWLQRAQRTQKIGSPDHYLTWCTFAALGRFQKNCGRSLGQSKNEFMFFFDRLRAFGKFKYRFKDAAVAGRGS